MWMDKKEFGAILLAIFTFTIIIALKDMLSGSLNTIGLALISATIIILVNIYSKILTAHEYNASVEHELWLFSRFGFKPHQKTKKPIPLGIILSLLISLLSAGWLMFSTLLTFETSAHKGSKRKLSGYVFTEMTDWHTALIGSIGIIAVLILSFISYFFPPIHLIAKAAAFYAFFNMIPFSKLDGAQIFYGSQVLWTALAIISALFTFVAIIL